ncbi:unnamed protein product [Phytophthora lilii]|uniref:Unnamed protein product n=1 Tax=Phytophthora lilii TaxID=2077276 RepID=A0A9W6TBM0_9STRA|nr:unnamed protein product [Phytophthora lilii]
MVAATGDGYSNNTAISTTFTAGTISARHRTIADCLGSLSVSWGVVVNALEPTIDGAYMPFTTSRLYVPFRESSGYHLEAVLRLTVNYQTWLLSNRVLIADVSRLTERDVPQPIQIQGTNAGCQGTNMIALVVSEQELTLDRLTGEILDFTTA